ncbi:MAG: primosomal protein N' [Bacteroidota bacterium]
MQHFINVILPIPLPKLFTYSVPERSVPYLAPGIRVAVPFGKSKIYTGLVHDIHSQPPQAYEAKEIHDVLDERPLIGPIVLQHWKWIAEYYLCTLGEVFRSALPGTFLLESETLVLRNEEARINEGGLKDDEFLVYEALQHQAVLKVAEVAAIIDRKNALPVLNRLLKKNVIYLKEEIFEKYRPKRVRFIRLGETYTSEEKLEVLLESLTRAPKQSQVLLSLFQYRAMNKKPLKSQELEKLSGTSRAVIKALIDKGILEEYELRMDRVNYAQGQAVSDLPILNPYQEKALEDIQRSFKDKKVGLLHGVTASGKTEVYFRLIQESLEKGGQVLYLLPEIALTAQLINRLQRVFGEKVSVYHSRYSMQERVEVWNNVLDRKNKARIVIGARSALFLPFSELRLIVVDEEHEESFKQFDPAPRYHARDAAIVLAKLHGSHIVLGSATPSISSYHNAKTGKYGYAYLGRRYGNVLMPDVELVDFKEQVRKKKAKGHFSERLLEEIAQTLNQGEQVILFQNRRGYAPILECTTCGHSPQCPNCDVSLTYHQHKRQLRCHYCGYHMAMLENCLACGSPTLDTKGFGTQQVEEELGELFPDANVARMDQDTTRGKYSYEKIITAFEQQETDVLVGTQMLSKGLDFRHVGLVGVMNADTLLNFPDYRAHERAYQLLTQVAGRAGRTEKRGKVIIQSYNPYHQILKQVSTHDYTGMYAEQLYQRELYKYPPAHRIIRITFKHKNFDLLNTASDWFAGSLRNVLAESVLGPEAPPVARIRNQFLKNLLIKMTGGRPLATVKANIRRVEKSFNAIAQFRGVRVIYHVDHI